MGRSSHAPPPTQCDDRPHLYAETGLAGADGIDWRDSCPKSGRKLPEDLAG